LTFRDDRGIAPSLFALTDVSGYDHFMAESDTSEPDLTNESLRRWFAVWRMPILWALFGTALGGGIGTGYGAWLFYSPDYREAYIRETLSQPHMDSQRYLAGVLAWRYRTLGSLVRQYGFAAALSGFAIGSLVGLVRREIREAKLVSDPRAKARPFSLIELMSVIAIITVLVSLLLPRNYGLVYYEQKDQFHWLMLLQTGGESEQREAVAALCEILKEPPFPCRSTIIPALAEAGPLAEPAIPVLKELAKDEELPVRDAAVEAIRTIRASRDESPSGENRP
jgi:hypothetical protein